MDVILNHIQAPIVMYMYIYLYIYRYALYMHTWFQLIFWRCGDLPWEAHCTCLSRNMKSSRPGLPKMFHGLFCFAWETHSCWWVLYNCVHLRWFCRPKHHGNLLVRQQIEWRKHVQETIVWKCCKHQKQGVNLEEPSLQVWEQKGEQHVCVECFWWFKPPFWGSSPLNETTFLRISCRPDRKALLSPTQQVAVLAWHLAMELGADLMGKWVVWNVSPVVKHHSHIEPHGMYIEQYHVLYTLYVQQMACSMIKQTIGRSTEGLKLSIQFRDFPGRVWW